MLLVHSLVSRRRLFSHGFLAVARLLPLLVLQQQVYLHLATRFWYHPRPNRHVYIYVFQARFNLE